MSVDVSVPTKQMFDRKFVIAATLIGVVYTALVVILGTVLGKEAAGVAGVALTALATGIFKQFETLRFRQQTSDAGVSINVPAFRIWYFLLILFAFFGLQTVLGFILGVVFVALGQTPDVSDPLAFSAFFSSWRLYVLLGVNAVAYFFGGYLVGKTAPSVTYTYAVVAAMLSLILPVIVQVTAILILGGLATLKLSAADMVANLYLAAFWLAYIFATLIGSKLGFRKNIPATAIAAQLAPSDISTATQD
jgi:hypothetical protein